MAKKMNERIRSEDSNDNLLKKILHAAVSNNTTYIGDVLLFFGIG